MAGYQRTADTPAGGGRADTPAGGGQADRGWRYTTDGHTCLRHGGKEDAEGAPTIRRGRERCISKIEYLPPGYFVHISITTPIASAFNLKNYNSATACINSAAVCINSA
jgi:hypothetical protein